MMNIIKQLILCLTFVDLDVLTHNAASARLHGTSTDTSEVSINLWQRKKLWPGIEKTWHPEEEKSLPQSRDMDLLENLDRAEFLPSDTSEDFQRRQRSEEPNLNNKTHAIRIGAKNFTHTLNKRQVTNTEMKSIPNELNSALLLDINTTELFNFSSHANQTSRIDFDSGINNPRRPKVSLSVMKTQSVSGATPDITTSVYANQSNISSQLTPISEQGLVSYNQSTQAVKWLRLFGPFLAVISFCCGILSAIVFSHKNLASHISPLIIAYNIGETFKAFSFILNRLWMFALTYKSVSSYYSYTQYFIYFVTWVPDTAGRIDLIFNALISIDRFLALAFPLKMMSRKFVRRPKVIIAVVVFLMFASQLGIILSIIIRIKPSRISQITSIATEMTFITKQYGDVLNIISLLLTLNAIAFRYVPMLIALVCNFLAIISILYHKKSLHGRSDCPESSGRQAQRRQTNITIVISSLVFTLLVSVKGILRVVGSLHPNFGFGKRERYLHNILSELGMLCDNLTSLGNILTYFLMSSVFRSCFWLSFARVFKTQMPKSATPISKVNIKKTSPAATIEGAR